MWLGVSRFPLQKKYYNLLWDPYKGYSILYIFELPDILSHPQNSPIHHSQSVAGWSCFFWFVFWRTGSLTTTWCFETKKHENSFHPGPSSWAGKMLPFFGRVSKKSPIFLVFFLLAKSDLLRCCSATNQPFTFPHGVQALYLQLGDPLQVLAVWQTCGNWQKRWREKCWEDPWRFWNAAGSWK